MKKQNLRRRIAVFFLVLLCVLSATVPAGAASAYRLSASDFAGLPASTGVYNGKMARNSAELCLSANDLTTPRIIGDFAEMAVTRYVRARTYLGDDYYLAEKTMPVGGKDRDVYMVVVRGSLLLSEFLGNFDILGDLEGHHRDFKMCATQIENKLRSFAGDDWKNCVFWICGYSRGAGIANLLAASLSGQGLQGRTYAYTFGSPGTKIMGTQINYNNIYNVINNLDIVPMCVPFFGRYGISKRFTASGIGQLRGEHDIRTYIEGLSHFG
jgi:hypothetical protein